MTTKDCNKITMRPLKTVNTLCDSFKSVFPDSSKHALVLLIFFVSLLNNGTCVASIQEQANWYIKLSDVVWGELLEEG